MKHTFLLLWCAVCTITSGFGQLKADQEEVAKQFLELLLQKQTQEVKAMFSPQFLKQVSMDQVEQIAQGLEEQLGEFSHIQRTVFEESDLYNVVVLVCRFGSMDWGFRVTLDKELKIAGFHLIMAPAEEFTPPPPYADSTLFSEKTMYIDCGDIELPATLTMPSSENDVPVVVLVHGSGPHDQDQTIGPNRPFRDVAWGLASQGIAVLRYEKRTFKNAHTLSADNITVWNETGSDAVHAVRTAMHLPGIDSNRVFLLGHSLGGIVAPRIALEATQLKGIISMAGSPRYLYEIIPQQIQHLYMLRGDTSQQAMKNLQMAKDASQSLSQKRNRPLAEHQTDLLGLPPSYWWDLNQHNTGQIAASLPQHILIMHGGRDYQVSNEDFEAWKRALKNHPHTTFLYYPELNHLFFAGEEVSGPDKYFQHNHVAGQAVKDIAGWIHQKR